MLQNPTVMQMMMSRMPPHMRKPEVLKAMMSNPEVCAGQARHAAPLQTAEVQFMIGACSTLTESRHNMLWRSFVCRIDS
jgi:hypothetical protein